MPWYTPLHALYALIHTMCFVTIARIICISTHHYAPYMHWYTLLHTYAMIHTTTNVTCLGTHHRLWYTVLHLTWGYTPQTFVHTTTHLVCCYMSHMPWCTPLHTFYALVHTSMQPTCLHTPLQTTCLDTHLICWYTPLHISYPLVHTTTHVICLGTHHCTCYMSWLHNAQLHSTWCTTPPKKELCARFLLNNSDSIKLARLKLIVHEVGVVTHIHTKLQASVMHSFRAILKFAKNAQLYPTRRYEWGWVR